MQSSFVCLFGATLVGILIRSRIPSYHLDIDSKEVIRLSTAVVGTLSALALGLLISSAKNVFDNAETELRTSVARVLLLDRVMAHYGPETKLARDHLNRIVGNRVEQGWDSPSGEAGADPYDHPRASSLCRQNFAILSQEPIPSGSFRRVRLK